MKLFEELHPQEVNEFIAENIMQWHKEYFKYEGEMGYVNKYESWVDKNGNETDFHVTSTIYSECNSQIFNPYYDLNHCRIVEDKLRLIGITDFKTNKPTGYCLYNKYINSLSALHEWITDNIISSSSVQRTKAFYLILFDNESEYILDYK